MGCWKLCGCSTTSFCSTWTSTSSATYAEAPPGWTPAGQQSLLQRIGGPA